MKNKKRTCTGCWCEIESQYWYSCELGYPTDGRGKPTGEMTCPKPTTGKKYLIARKNFLEGIKK